MSSEELTKLLDLARTASLSPSDAEAQRRSFAFGNTHFENEDVTRATVDRAAEALVLEDE